MNFNNELKLKEKIMSYPQRITLFLFVIIISLVLAGVAVQIYGNIYADNASKTIIELFDLNAEANIPTWYSSFALLFSAILLTLIALIKTVQRDNYVFHWKMMSLIFLFMSIDEISSLHEILNYHFKNIIKNTDFFYFGWVFFGGIFVLLFMILYSKFLFNLNPKTRNLFILAGTIYISGALAMEMMAGNYIYHYGSSVISARMSIFEEFLEMTGIAIFIYALLSYITAHIQEFNIIINDINLKSINKSKLKNYCSDQKIMEMDRFSQEPCKCENITKST